MNARLALTGPLLVFDGPYSNLKATRAILAEAERARSGPSEIVCTGDVADVPRLYRVRAEDEIAIEGASVRLSDPFG